MVGAPLMSSPSSSEEKVSSQSRLTISLKPATNARLCKREKDVNMQQREGW
jgi:hypothetical protein